jgi:hypothetical protein
MARRTDITGSLRAVSCSQPDEADPLGSPLTRRGRPAALEKSAELAIALKLRG